ncbi:MAG: hypothetical protein IPN74_04435, partial [Haliscomenobacter sp.]|nr:hypothetical protein [Haliscomenobacter sp.]
MIKRLFLFAILAAGVFAANAQTADEIVAKYFDVTGGIDKWRALKTTKMTGTMSAQGMDFSAIMFNAPPNKMRVDVSIMGQNLVQAYDGTTAWWINPFQGSAEAQVMPDEMAAPMKEQEFQNALLDYASKGHSIALEGKETVEGTACHKIKLTKKDGTVEYHLFDTESSVLIVSRTAAKAGPAAGEYTDTFLSDYQEVNGF